MQTVQTENALPTSEGLRISPDGRILFATRFVHLPLVAVVCFIRLALAFYNIGKACL